MFPKSRISAASLAMACLLAGVLGCDGGATSAAGRLSEEGASRESRTATRGPGSDVGSGSAAPAEEATPVRIHRVEPQPFDDAVQVSGELRANEEVDLRAEEAGRVVGLFFDEGQRVDAGALLVKINDADLQAEQRRTEVERSMALRREERMATLLAEKTISQEVYDEARGQLEVLDAELELIEARIAKTEIHAPFAGVLGLRTVSKGSYLTSSQVVATLQNLDPIKIDFAVPEKYAGVLGPGAEVELEVAGRAETFTGRVYAVEPRIDAATRTVKVRARAPNPRRLLLPGAFVEVRLLLARLDDALLIPSIALVPGLGATTVYVAEDGVARPREVRIGRRTAEKVQIVDGLEAGDLVITSGLQQIKPGSPVSVR